MSTDMKYEIERKKLKKRVNIIEVIEADGTKREGRLNHCAQHIFLA
jgi:hypothetical protein